jgi:hypothetical protein
LDFNIKSSGKKTNLFLDQRQLLQVSLQERHLLLLGFAVAIANDVVVLLLDLIELDFEFDNLKEKLV